MGYRVARIVQPGKSNTKIAHGERFDIRSCTVSLAASDTAGFNVCSRAIPRSRINRQLAEGWTLEQVIADGNAKGLSACSVSCVTNEAGKGAAPFVRKPRVNLTKWYRENRAEFTAHLMDELRAECSAAAKRGQIAACRPNVDSDVPWERTVPQMFDLPMQFWDYTKVSTRLGRVPANYHLTYSVNDGTQPEDWQRVYDSGCNISVVFDTFWQPGGHENGRKFGQLPTWYTDANGYRWRVIDGDQSDFRWLDDGPVCVGLRLKGFSFGRMVARLSGFAAQVPRAVRGVFSKVHPSKAA